MKTILVTGSGGLIGRETCEFFLKQGFYVVGIDNNMREQLFGKDGSVDSNIDILTKFPNYFHYNYDIRFPVLLKEIFRRYNVDIRCVVHTAAQPSHDWAVKDPFTDYEINATATLNLLELTRQWCPNAVFIFTSTNKVYGDNPNKVAGLTENATRYEVYDRNGASLGFDESLSVDQCTHSLFGCSKLAADAYVQEYGKYFGMKTTVFRGGCLTGPKHKGAELHGFLSYLVKCCLNGKPYNIFGHNGKQVRDNIHSADLVSAFWEVFKNPKCGEVFNIGGSRYSNCSMLEAIALTEKLSGKKMITTYIDKPRVGDHIWWISNVYKFQTFYPEWKYTYNIESIIKEIIKHA